MNLLNRFVRYVTIDTESDENGTTTPSTAKQFDLAKILVKELEVLGLVDIELTDTCIIYAKLPANTDKECPKIGFISHMDTSPDMSGANVKPQMLKNYQGGVITLNKELGIKLDPKEFPCLLHDIGADLICTDGTTLLGADDKAGIAEIMQMLEYLVTNPSVEHGDIMVAFTPDEEIGTGVHSFDVERFGADYAYTVDGGNVDEMEYENFNAASASLKFHGRSIHPGSAKGKMINSQLVAMEFNSLLPTFDNPAYTEGYEGFNHLLSMQGSCEYSELSYIIRNHDRTLLEKQEQDFRNAAEFINKKYGANTVELVIEESYSNMIEILKDHMDIVERAMDKMRVIGLEPKAVAIRGGTDGAQLTYRGLPCPNLGTGGRNYHGKYEYANFNEMLKVVELLIEIAKVD